MSELDNHNLGKEPIQSSAESPHGKWFIHHLVRLQGELSEVNRRLDETKSRQTTIIWGICLVGFALLINLFR